MVSGLTPIGQRHRRRSVARTEPRSMVAAGASATANVVGTAPSRIAGAAARAHHMWVMRSKPRIRARSCWRHRGSCNTGRAQWRAASRTADWFDASDGPKSSLERLLRACLSVLDGAVHRRPIWRRRCSGRHGRVITSASACSRTNRSGIACGTRRMGTAHRARVREGDRRAERRRHGCRSRLRRDQLLVARFRRP